MSEPQMASPGDEVARAGHAGRIKLYRFSWLLWIVGSAVIVLSWIKLVSPEVGWIGFAVALSGTLLSMVAHIPVRVPADDSEPPQS